MSLDGYINTTSGDTSWIAFDPAFDFAALWSQFDTFLMGRRTYEAATARLGASAFRSGKTFVASRTLAQSEHPEITVVSEPTTAVIEVIRARASKDIWLFGGGELASHLLAQHQVDTVEVSVIPVVLGSGVPLLSPSASHTKLDLVTHKIYPSGIAHLVYRIHKN